MNGMEKLREYADATKWGGECRILHAHHGDFAGECSERECSECKAAYLHAIADEVQENMRDADARMMPEGMAWLLEVWPKWSNGEYCKFGDWWTADKYGDYEPKQLRRLAFFTPEQLREWEQDEGDNFGYEWDFMRPSDTTYRPDKVEPPAPKVLDADGVEIREGETVYVLGFGEPLTVKGFADDGRVLMSFHDEDSLGYKPSKLTHEQPDTWQRIEDDAKKNACEVFHPGEEECGGCRFEGKGNCEEELRLELVKRCKALAEKED